jgi:hypothetical protein
MGIRMSLVPTLSTETALLAGLALGVCLLCLYMVFFFGRKLTLQTHLRNTLVEGTVRLEMDSCVRDLRDKAYSGPLNPVDNPFPSEAKAIGISHNLWLSQNERERSNLLYLQEPYYQKHQEWVYEDYVSQYKLDPKSFTKEQFDRWQAGENKRIDEDNERNKLQYQQRKIAIDKYLEWETKEQRIFELKKSELEGQARAKVENDLPKSMDVSILGSGFSFLLEFSTVIVIIFALIILGIIGLFEGREIAAILAAIAGYVLGKGSRAVSSQKEEKTSSAIQNTS